jgi:hypothetical protein
MYLSPAGQVTQAMKQKGRRSKIDSRGRSLNVTPVFYSTIVDVSHTKRFVSDTNPYAKQKATV